LLSECKGTPFFCNGKTFRHFFRPKDEKSAFPLMLIVFYSFYSTYDFYRIY